MKAIFSSGSSKALGLVLGSHLEQRRGRAGLGALAVRDPPAKAPHPSLIPPCLHPLPRPGRARLLPAAFAEPGPGPIAVFTEQGLPGEPGCICGIPAGIDGAGSPAVFADPRPGLIAVLADPGCIY